APNSSGLAFAGEAEGRGLNITLGGQTVVIGSSFARVQSGQTSQCPGTACARATGAVGQSATAEAASPGNPGPHEVAAFDIGRDGSPQLQQLFTGVIGAVSAQTSATTADAEALAVDLAVTLNQTVLGQLPAAGVGQLDDALEQLGDALAPLVAADPTGTIGGLVETLTDLVDNLVSTPVVQIFGGDSESSASFAN